MFANFATWQLVLVYIVLFSVTTVNAVYLSRIINIFDAKTKISSIVLGGGVLGAITSLPEFITIVTAVMNPKDVELACGNIMGSNLFDIFILAVILIIYIKAFRDKKLSITNNSVLIFSILGSIFVLLAIFTDNTPMNVGGFNFFSLFIFVFYGLSIYYIFKTNTKDGSISHFDSNNTDQKGLWKISLPILSVIFVAFIIVLVVTAIFLTYSASELINRSGMDKTTGGAILLGFITSLPEVICTISLCRMKNYDLAVSDIVGSCTFNINILFIANIFSAASGSKHLYVYSPQIMIQTGLFILLGLVFSFYCLFNAVWKQKWAVTKNQILVWNSCLLAMCIVIFAVFLGTSFINF